MEPENSLDVVVIGASETYTAIAPGMLWEDYGFTSYLYAVSGGPISLVKSQIIEIRKRQDPKLIVVEINGAVPRFDTYQTRESSLRSYIDNIPWSDNKIQTIREVVPKEEQMTYFVPFLKYHSNWKCLDSCFANSFLEAKMRMNGCSLLKGYQTYAKEQKPQKKLVDVENDTSTAALTEPAEYYLRDLLESLKAEKIENVLFVRMPHRVTEKYYGDYQRSNEAGKMIQEYGYSYVSFEPLKEEIGLDMETDFYNDHHMNVYGQEKFTGYFGTYLTEHYDLKGIVHSEEQIKRWNETSQETKECIEYAKQLIERKEPRTVNEGWRAAGTLHINR
ncbi:MAG: hypothetical protein ACI4D7_08950 [Lachnospiraceae bacterium]